MRVGVVDMGAAYRLGWKAIPFARELLLSNCGNGVSDERPLFWSLGRDEPW